MEFDKQWITTGVSFVGWFLLRIVKRNQGQPGRSLPEEQMSHDVRRAVLSLCKVMEESRGYHGKESKWYNGNVGIDRFYERGVADLDEKYSILDRACFEVRVQTGVDFDDELHQAKALVEEYKFAFRALRSVGYAWGPFREQYPQEVVEIIIQNNNQCPDNTVNRIHALSKAFERKIRPFVKTKG